MKKIYTFIVALMAMFATTAQAQIEVVTEIGPTMTSLEGLKEGSKIALFCYGESNRRAFLREVDNQKIHLSRKLHVGSTSSSDFVWTVLSVEPFDGGCNIKLQSPRHNFVPNFPYDENSTWVKWPGATCLSADSAAIISVTVPEATEERADSFFYFRDENNVYFNGQNLADYNSEALFVGWNDSGENSLYQIFPLTTEVRTAVPTTLYLQTTEGEEIETRNLTLGLGDSVTVPTLENYAYQRADNYATGDEIQMPYHVNEIPEGGNLEIGLYYKHYPMVAITCQDEEGNPMKDENIYVPFGYEFHGDSVQLGQLGYELVENATNNQTINEDTEITLVYKKTPLGGVPFVPTTIEGGKFAEGTHFYTMRIRNGYYIYQKTGESAVKAGASIAVSDSVDSYLWAFTGNLEDGFQLWNKAMGPEVKVYVPSTSNGAALTFGSDDEIAANETPVTAFKMTINGNGFALSAAADANACLNQFGGKTGTDVKFWNDGESPTDGGSKIVFAEMTDADAEGLKWSTPKAWAAAEGCVGGYTADQLATLKTAIAAGDMVASKAAIETLKEAETIAFDANKSYYLVAGFKDFESKQPGVKYAIYADASDTVRWAKLDEASDEYKWEFYAASDTTYFVGNVAHAKPIVGFRFGKWATLEGGTELGEVNESNVFAVGAPAPFQIVKANVDVVPGAFYLVHNYGGSIITLAGKAGAGDATATSGKITTYNTREAAYNNSWRLVPAGAFTNGINNAEVIEPAQQNGVVYDLSGRRVAKAQNGLYIVNGKKVIVK